MKTTTQDKTRDITNENSQTTVELYKTGTTAIGITSVLLGGWAVACMTAGVIASGGPIALASEYLKVIVG